jgi:Txe/YoeB family toxin of toxin-antitoxin system
VLAVLTENPFQNPPRYEKVVGDLVGAHSRRLSIQRRLVYEFIPEQNFVMVLRIWSHYE